MKNFFLLLTLSFILHTVNGQVYYCGDDSRIGVFNAEDCSYTTFPTNEPTIRLADITFTPEGRLIAIGYPPFDGMYSAYLIELFLDNGVRFDTLLEIPSLTGSLACDRDGLLYLGGSQIYTYDLETQFFNYLSPVPSSSGVNGDVVFVDDILYGSAFRFFVESTDNQFVSLDLVPNDTFFGDIITTEYPQFGGLAKFYDPEQERYRLIGAEPSNIVGPAQSATFHEIFLADTTHQALCTLTMEGNPPRGLAGPDDFRTNFALRLDLDEDDSSGRFIDHYLSDSLCAVSYRLADEDVYIRAPESGIDSLVVNIHSGIQQPSAEVLVSVPHPLFQLTAVNATRLLAVPVAAVTDEDYADLIRSLRFELTDPDPLPGERRIDLTLYAEGQAADAAYAFIRVQPEVELYAGQDYTLELCPYHVANLMTGLGPDVYQEGYWLPALQIDNNFYEPNSGDQPGIYRYIAQEGSCGPDTAIVEINTSAVPPLNYGGVPVDIQDVYLCPGDTAVWTIDTDYTNFWFWNSDASSDTTQLITAPTIEGFQVQDNEGCDHFFRTRFLTPEWGDQMQTDYDTLLLCGGTTTEFYGQTISTDTTLCELLTASTSDCGSELCRTFRFAYAASFALDADICQGESYAWYDQNLTTAGTYQYVLPGAGEQCDTLYTLTLNVTPPPTVAEAARICEGESYSWFGQDLSTAATYDYLDEFGAGCDTLYQLTLAIDSTYTQDLNVVIVAGESYPVGDLVFTAAGMYIIPLTTVAGCDSIINLNLDVISSTETIARTECGLTNAWARGLRPWQWQCAEPVTLQRWALYDSQGRRVQHASPQRSGQSFTLLSATAQQQLAAGVYFYELFYQENGASRRLSGKVVMW
jgi:hypothetical protein